ncbi:MAG: carbamoyl-phosphate synthase domain-containing protein, partial [Alphaproteobacteria bacterium]
MRPRRLRKVCSVPLPGLSAARSRRANAALALTDGTVYWGEGFGATGRRVGEVCFNTAMTGYQEILTDPSYAGQIITFTFPHIGNVGANAEDIEATTPAARGMVVRERVTAPSNFRSADRLESWLARHGLVGIAGLDTRALVRRVRAHGFQNGALEHGLPGSIDADALVAAARAWPGLEGMDLALEVTCRQSYAWDET